MRYSAAEKLEIIRLAEQSLIVGESAERFQSREHDERHNSPSPYLLKPLEC
jgi:hypothetical protein